MCSCSSIDEHIFPGVVGPEEVTVVSPLAATSPDLFKEGGKSRLAIYLTDPSSSWLGLVRGFKSIGIPFIITQDYEEALRHQVVLVYPYLTGKNANNEVKVDAYKSFVKKGGVLITCELQGSLSKFWGVDLQLISKKRGKISFKNHSWTKPFIHPHENTVQIGNTNNIDGTFSTTAFIDSNAISLATYEDNNPAIIEKQFGEGKIVLFGFDIGAFINRSFNNRQPILDHYVNTFMPSTDVFLRLIKEIYIHQEPDSVTINTVPHNKSLAVIITHDVDYSKAVENSIAYAEYEKKEGIKASYFVLTHYIKDYNDSAFFNKNAISIFSKIRDKGMEIASHSVSHSLSFNHFPLGTGKESYPKYLPRVVDNKNTINGSILGELRVSKFLLEGLLNAPCPSFRPGYLRQPTSLPQCLMATNYKYSSSTTANNAWTHLPFQLTCDNLFDTLVDVFEFPITIEDLAPPRMDQRIDSAIDVAKNISRYGGICVVLIHPDVIDYKLKFEKEFIEGVKPISWLGSMSDFGDFWSARNKISLDITEDSNTKQINMHIPEPIYGITLTLPKDWVFKDVIPKTTNVSQQGTSLIIDYAIGDVQIIFDYFTVY